MIDRFCVVFRVLFAFDVKLRNLKYATLISGQGVMCKMCYG